MSQLEAGTWLEVSGIDSGRFKAGVAPNLEALSSSLNGFKQRYHSLFEHQPRFFQAY